jgi:hypothetical protein
MLGRYDIFEGLIGKGSVRGGNPKAPPLAVHSASRRRDARDLLNMLSRELGYLASARFTAEKSSRNSREIEICRGSIYLFTRGAFP